MTSLPMTQSHVLHETFSPRLPTLGCFTVYQSPLKAHSSTFNSGLQSCSQISLDVPYGKDFVVLLLKEGQRTKTRLPQTSHLLSLFVAQISKYQFNHISNYFTISQITPNASMYKVLVTLYYLQLLNMKVTDKFGPCKFAPNHWPLRVCTLTTTNYLLRVLLYNAVEVFGSAWSSKERQNN